MLKGAALLAGGLVVGLLLGIFGPQQLHSYVDTNWHPLAVSDKYFGVSYSTEVAFSDLPIGTVTELTGQAKFLDSIYLPTHKTRFGYLIHVTMQDPDRAKIPERYLKRSVVQIGGREAIIEPINHVSYAIQFTFVLKDRDGFDLQTLVSKEQTLVSGQTNKLQNTIDADVSYATAAKAKTVQVQPSIVKCHTCKE